MKQPPTLLSPATFFDELIAATGLCELASLNEAEITLLRMAATGHPLHEMAATTGMNLKQARRMADSAKARLEETIRNLVDLERSASGGLILCESLLATALSEVRRRRCIENGNGNISN